MAIDRARAHLRAFDMDGRILVFEVSSATVELAAQAAGVIPARIAKSLSFMTADGPILVVTAGDMKIDNSKFKARFRCKAKMLGHDEVEALIGHGVGGVCPFGIEAGVRVYLDESMKRFDTVFPACGSANSAIELTCDELERVAQNFEEWVDVCKPSEMKAQAH